jgi:hypothetical protein
MSSEEITSSSDHGEKAPSRRETTSVLSPTKLVAFKLLAYDGKQFKLFESPEDLYFNIYELFREEVVGTLFIDTILVPLVKTFLRRTRRSPAEIDAVGEHKFSMDDFDFRSTSKKLEVEVIPKSMEQVKKYIETPSIMCVKKKNREKVPISSTSPWRAMRGPSSSPSSMPITSRRQQVPGHLPGTPAIVPLPPRRMSSASVDRTNAMALAVTTKTGRAGAGWRALPVRRQR